MESLRMDNMNSKSELPAWRMPISTSFSSSLRDKEDKKELRNNEEDNSAYRNNESKNNNEKAAVSRTNSNLSEEESQTVIQILLPCIICNRTFSPEALERHSKVCTKVNIKSPYKPERGTFDISEKRKKGTKLEAFIPPPQTFDALTDNRFSRGNRNRASLRGTSCTTRSTLTPQRRDRSVSQSREPSISRQSSVAPQGEYDDTSEFSNNSDENNLPSYAKPIAPTDVCPFCQRTFGVKSYDRHVEFCKEVYERKRYEIQPTPKEREVAMERQELRTKYRPMKSSSSCTSLRSMSPGKDFATMAMKLFGGLRRTEGSSNLYFNQIKNNLKKSNESIANSCYGDYTRGLRRGASPSPSRPQGGKLNNVFATGSGYHGFQSMLPMRVNTTGNIPKTKSTDSLNNFAHVPSSGYGQQQPQQQMNNFSRNSRSRSSLHKNFFRTKRAEPDGTENTSLSQSPTSTSPLIITPVNFYSKGKVESKEASRPAGGTLLTSDPDYDPYEKAAKQLEELLKTTPIKQGKQRSSRRTGLAKAFESVGVPQEGFLPALGKTRLGRAQSLDYQGDPFGLGNVRGRPKAQDPFGIGGMSMTPNIDDSYWDEILRKGDNQTGGNNRQEVISSQEESDTSASDTAKSRAMSNTSSADSAFSRSEVTDPEFEALETIVGLGEISRFRKPQQERTKSVDYFGNSSKLLESLHRSVPRSASVDHGRTPMDTQTERVENSGGGGGNGGGWAKFCFECGTPYPTVLAKFCSECGEKRVLKV